jgi:aminopeptidase 2
VLHLATKDLIHQAQYGLDIKAKVLPVYEKVFDIEFPLPKLDTLVVSEIADKSQYSRST